MEEKMRILKWSRMERLLQQKAAELMSAMGVEEASGLPQKQAYDKKMFRIIVDSVQGDKVNVQFPVGAIKKS